ILKKIKFPYPILMHAYGGNDFEMQELLKYPVYFSYGARIFNTEKRLLMTPLDKLLLETGDQSDYSITDIYIKAASILNIPMEELEKRLEQNFLNFFGKHDDVSAANFIKDLNERKTFS
ncbi:MAG: TatD family hydrolase, partial [Bdellovibrionales bacterium]|nr:TatD family hydrolase [Bdellovibrionales bacterium]